MAARRPSYPQARAIAVHRDERSAATGRWLMLGLALIVGFAVVAWSGAGRAASVQQNPRQNLPIASPDFAPLEKWSGAIARDRAAGTAPWQGFLAEMRGASRAPACRSQSFRQRHAFRQRRGELGRPLLLGGAR